MLKMKRMRTADCVVGGFRYADPEARWSARCCSGSTTRRAAAPRRLHLEPDRRGPQEADAESWRPLVQAPGFTGHAPGGPSRWSTERSAEWEPLAPGWSSRCSTITSRGDRFRHGTRFLRWRPDKSPAQCKFDQLQPKAAICGTFNAVQSTYGSAPKSSSVSMRCFSAYMRSRRWRKCLRSIRFWAFSKSGA